MRFSSPTERLDMVSYNDKPSRREFIIGMAAGTAGSLLVSRNILAAVPTSEHGILIDTTLCKYCKECIRACEEKHQDGTPGTHYIDVTLTHPLREDPYALVAPENMNPDDLAEDALPVPLFCIHCIDAPCVTACQSIALVKTPLGAVTLDQNKCIGCLACISVCPIEKCLHYQAFPPKMFKCDMCYDRIVEGNEPACVDACRKIRYDALIFGPFNEIYEEGKRRAEERGGVLLYPEDSHSLILFDEKKFNAPMLADMFGFTRSYSGQARTKANLTQWAHLGWLPIMGGLYFYLRGNGKSTGPEKEEG